MLGDIIKNAEDDESKVFYNKMKADYFRYKAEVASADNKKGKMLCCAHEIQIFVQKMSTKLKRLMKKPRQRQIKWPPLIPLDLV